MLTKKLRVAKILVVLALLVTVIHGKDIGKYPERNPVTISENLQVGLDFHNFSSTSDGLRCGGVITESYTTITYKLFQPLANNERCVWVIAIPNANHLEIRLSSLGFNKNSTDALLSATGLKHGHLSLHKEELSELFKFYIFDDVDVAWITLQTGTLPPGFEAHGFELKVYAYQTKVHELTPKLSSTSKHVLFAGDNILYQYPGRDLSYGNNELSTFFFLPKDNLKNPEKKRKIVYQRIGLEPSCKDYLAVYFFRPYSGQWELMGTVCDQIDATTILGDDLVLVVFNSDYGNVGPGFHLTAVESNNCG